ncbi:DNA polymerase III subunit delta' [Marinomonas posidonica]|uniref:DNA-directed DNA polymerase n=1 Tax=Marinomonas posidonica (strain CECT 7376 / NCIMB 14433 / IVIA-Po-181) TaxID=491952 RepID=F6CZZ2_MARPP|nr:DNA polymerase III subunit delta' [Marinomonas posidonica]AEF54732.1 DNA polymerase III, delta prime subunit [Marinomonas posidonica IVIA-Po-181]
MSIAPWLQHSLLQVQQLKVSGGLSHALLITGADGVGQESLAFEMAKDLMCESEQASACGQCHSCQLMAADTHPDFRVLDGESGTIKVDQIRNLVQKITQKPQVGQTKVVLISHAQSMNINAANAVLKALEEPSDRTFFLLTSSQSSRLLPTIRSRCLLVSVPTPNVEQVDAWLAEHNQEANLSRLFWLTTQPFRLLSIEKNQKAELFLSLPEKVNQFLQQEMTVAELLKGLDSQNIEDYCNGLAAILHQSLCHSAGAPIHPALEAVYANLIRRIGIRALMDRYQAIQNLKLALQKTNLNPIMQLTNELNQW